ncbi:MAG: HNH endonuclease [Oscillospiraceae bacterium]|jgi:5-methylcytosine-specific restriction endonuclease McrA|nr:HNH endonuclease [Oscillospiraceae bacterium]
MKDFYGRTNSFYLSTPWLKLRQRILEQDKHECQRCRRLGRYSPAVIVHHVNHVDTRPDLLLEEFYDGADGERKRNLVSLCRECHKLEHGRDTRKRNRALTVERW